MNEPFYLNHAIQKLVDDQGRISEDRVGLVDECKKAAEGAAFRMLGCTLIVHGKRFVISSLELYYGGIGDDAHDWYKKRFACLASKMREYTAVQEREGLMLYFANNFPKSKYRRMDIVIGREGVPCSLLIRNVRPEGESRDLAPASGGPCTILGPDGLNIGFTFHGKKIDSNPNSLIYFEDTHAKYANKALEPRRRFANGKFDGVGEKLKSEKWNFSLG